MPEFDSRLRQRHDAPLSPLEFIGRLAALVPRHATWCPTWRQDGQLSRVEQSDDVGFLELFPRTLTTETQRNWSLCFGVPDEVGLGLYD
jgi:hypothetical protein